MLKTIIHFGFSLSSLCICCAGQSDKPLHFEVASVKPVAKESAVRNRQYGGPGTSDPGRIIWTRISLRELITFAFEKYDYSHVSGPDSLDSTYEISAIIPPGTTWDQVDQMIGNLLVERFALRFHGVAKEVNGYNLTIARGSATKLTSSPPVEAALEPSGESATPGTDMTNGLSHTVDSKGFLVLPPGAKFQSVIADGIAHLTFKNSSMAYLANSLSLFFTNKDRVPIVDKTGLNGEFDFHLEYAGLPDDRPGGSEITGSDFPFDLRMVNPTLEKQLGLTLSPAKVMVDYMAVDHLETAPTEN